MLEQLGQDAQAEVYQIFLIDSGVQILYLIYDEMNEIKFKVEIKPENLKPKG